MSADIVNIHVTLAAVKRSLGLNFHFRGESRINPPSDDVTKVVVYRMDAGPHSATAIVGCNDEGHALGVAVDLVQGSHLIRTVKATARDFVFKPQPLDL